MFLTERTRFLTLEANKSQQTLYPYLFNLSLSLCHYISPLSHNTLFSIESFHGKYMYLIYRVGGYFVHYTGCYF